MYVGLKKLNFLKKSGYVAASLDPPQTIRIITQFSL